MELQSQCQRQLQQERGRRSLPQLATPACRTPTTPCTPEQRFLQLQLTQDGKPCQPQQAHYGAWSRLHRCCHREQLFRHQQAAAATAAAAGGETTATTAAHDCVGCALPDELGHAAALSSKGSSEGRAGRTFAHRVLAQGCGKLAGQIASTLTSERALAAWGLPLPAGPCCGSISGACAPLGLSYRLGQPALSNTHAPQSASWAPPRPACPGSKNRKGTRPTKKRSAHIQAPPVVRGWGAGMPAAALSDPAPSAAGPAARAAHPASPGGGLASGTARRGAVGGAARRGGRRSAGSGGCVLFGERSADPAARACRLAAGI